MTKAIIFDLDSCLSAADEPGQQLYAPAFDAITRASRGSHSPAVLQNAFADILHDYRLQPDQVLLVGDNHDSEIAIGARLGLRTVQTLRPGVPRSPAATHHIQTLQELKPLLAVKG
jgi:FMN phosphatase YigB (HAD superfamily)